MQARLGVGDSSNLSGLRAAQSTQRHLISRHCCPWLGGRRLACDFLPGQD